MEFKHGEMKVNLFFKKGTDVGAVADSIIDMLPNMTAFNEATEYKATNKKDLHVSRSADLNLFTDFETYITVDPLSNRGEELASLIIGIAVAHEDFTIMNAEPLVVNA